MPHDYCCCFSFLFFNFFLFFLGDPFETTWNPASVVNNCYFLCNFIFVISAPLESVFGLANIHIYYMQVYLRVGGGNMEYFSCSRFFNVMPYILWDRIGDWDTDSESESDLDSANKSLR